MWVAVPKVDGLGYGYFVLYANAFCESVKAGADQWHEQLEPNSCAIASQQFVISEYTGLPVTEAELIETASQMGWYEGLGTSSADVGNLLMACGIEVTIRPEGDFDDLASALAAGDRVLTAVQNMAMTAYNECLRSVLEPSQWQLLAAFAEP